MDRSKQPMATVTKYLIGAVCSCMLLTACSGTDDEAAIKELIKTGAELAEQKQIGDMIDLTTEDFVTTPGMKDRRMVRRILFAAFAHYKNFSILYPQLKIEIAEDGANAVVEFPFAILRKDRQPPALTELYGDPQGWAEKIGEQGDLFHIKMQLRKQGSEWLVAQATLFGVRRPTFITK
jgi:hypothetical protein